MTKNEYVKLVNSLEWGDRYVVNRKDLAPGTLYPVLLGERFRAILTLLENFIHDDNDAEIADVGAYPGALGRLMKSAFPRCVVDGVGLGFTESFKKEMVGGGVYRNFYEVDLDPEHPKSRSIPDSGLKARYGHYDFVVASEIIEHLYSPLFFIDEIRNLLKEKGTCIVTTPNVACSGNIFRLLRGGSNYESLETSHIFSHSDWRPHMRIYSSSELRFLFERAGFREVRHFFIDNKEDIYSALPGIRLKMFLIKSLYIISKFRNQYIGVFEKK